MEKLFNQYREQGFSEFKGLHIDATIPITEAVLNEAVQEILGPHNDNVQHLRLSIRDQNTLNCTSRHSIARHLKNQRFSGEFIQNFLGQESIKTTTNTYGTMYLDEMEEIATTKLGV